MLTIAFEFIFEDLTLGGSYLEAVQEDNQLIAACFEQSEVIQKNVVHRRANTDQLVLGGKQQLSQQLAAGPPPRARSFISNDKYLGDG